MKCHSCPCGMYVFNGFSWLLLSNLKNLKNIKVFFDVHKYLTPCPFFTQPVCPPYPAKPGCTLVWRFGRRQHLIASATCCVADLYPDKPYSHYANAFLLQDSRVRNRKRLMEFACSTRKPWPSSMPVWAGETIVTEWRAFSTLSSKWTYQL
jgi:hypothetical protein